MGWKTARWTSKTSVDIVHRPKHVVLQTFGISDISHSFKIGRANSRRQSWNSIETCYMKTSLLDIPPEDRWFIARLSRILATRLIEVSDPPELRRSLLRTLFGLKRLPELTPGLIVSVSAGQQQLELSTTHLGFASYTTDGHTEFQIEYFEDSSHCLQGYDSLDGSARVEATTFRLLDFEDAMKGADELSVEDLSTTSGVDDPGLMLDRFGGC